MKPKIYYDRESDTLSIWNGIPASEAEDVAEHLVADFDNDGEVVGFTLERASELLRPHLMEDKTKTDKLQRAFADLKQCHKKIRREYSDISDATLEKILGE